MGLREVFVEILMKKHKSNSVGHRGSRLPSKAFTLIELPVVIASIANGSGTIPGVPW
jgi:hypothetical protein